MFLALDIGNSSTAGALYEKGAKSGDFRIPSETIADPKKLIAAVQNLGQEIDAIGVASVVPKLRSAVDTALRELCKREPVWITAKMDLGIVMKVPKPEGVGVDRIVDAAAAYQLLGGPVIVVDVGTATTVNVVDSSGNFLGGAIAPGLSLSAEALGNRTAQLPKVFLVPPSSSIGNDTESALQSGCVLGHAGVIDGLVNRMRRELGAAAPVVATGGLVELVAPFAETFSAVVPDLTLDGIRLVAERNLR